MEYYLYGFIIILVVFIVIFILVFGSSLIIGKIFKKRFSIHKKLLINIGAVGIASIFFGIFIAITAPRGVNPFFLYSSLIWIGFVVYLLKIKLGKKRKPKGDFEPKISDTNLSKCPNCGANIDRDAKFCDECGYKLSSLELSNDAELNRIKSSICSKCGEPIKPNTNFCMNCGERIYKYRKGAFVLAGWLTIIGVIMTFPLLMLNIPYSLFYKLFSAIGLTGRIYGVELVYLIMVYLINLVVLVFVFNSFRHLLKYLYNFHDADKYIIILICLYSIRYVYCFALSFERFLYIFRNTPILSIYAIILALIVVAIIIFLIKFWRFPKNLFGLRKPFIYVLIIEAICFALASALSAQYRLDMKQVADLIVSFVSIARYIILGMVFFRTGKQLSAVNS